MLRALAGKALKVGWGERLHSLLESNLLWAFSIGGAVLLRLRQLQADLSFGNDEAALARNIVERSFSGLTQPLGYRQGAPILFLFVQKAFFLVFGSKDLVLEFFPLLAGCISIYLLYRIAKRHFGAAGLFAVIAAGLSLWLVSYSANPKQYSTDAMVTLFLLDLADRCLLQQAHGRDFLLLAIAGAAAIWLSHPAAFILPGIGLVLLFTRYSGKDRKAVAWLIGIGIAWAAAFGADYFISLRHLSVDAYLQKYWQAYFMPMPPWSHASWLLDAYRSLLLPVAGRTDLFALLIWSPLILIGAVSLVLADRPFAWIVLLPFGLTLIASAMHEYPVWDRLLLFLVPLVYLLAAEGLRRIFLWGQRWNRVAGIAAAAVIGIAILWPMLVSAKRNFFAPPHPWDMRPVVAYMSRNWAAGDTVFVSGGGETFAYYAEVYGLRPAQLTVENSHRIVRFFVYRRSLQAYAGRDRVWIVFAHFEEQSFQHQRYAKYLNRVGEIRDSFQAGFARAYLCAFDP